MKFHNPSVISIYILLLIFWSCNTKITSTEPAPKFIHVNVSITENGVKNIQNCANWYIDFSRIKKSMVYKDKIICVGLNGGFACLNSSDFTQDSMLENKMNSDFYTDASVLNDTLFAEKFDKIYFWNSVKWIEYDNPLPIKYFNVLKEDITYIFYTSNIGHYGCLIFVYNKKTKITKADFTFYPKSIHKAAKGYYVGTRSPYIIIDPEKLETVPNTMRHEWAVFHADERYAFIRDTGLLARNNFQRIRFKLPYYSSVVGTVIYKGDVLYIIQPRWQNLNSNFKYIGKVVNDSFETIDSLQNFEPETSVQFGKTTIINEYRDGFSLIRNDTFFKIIFKTLHPNYQGPAVDGYYLSTDTSKKLTAKIKYTYNNYYDENNNFKLKEGHAEREIDYTVAGKYKISGNYGSIEDRNYIYIGKKQFNLKFHDQWNFMEQIFVYDQRLFVLFGYFGNFGFQKYGLIEITDIEKFAATYKS